jgi:ribonuclease BN (tRNA processing enzyme)
VYPGPAALLASFDGSLLAKLAQSSWLRASGLPRPSVLPVAVNEIAILALDPPSAGRGATASWSTAGSTQHQLLRRGAGFGRLDRLLLTHGHSTTCSAFRACFRRCGCGKAPMSRRSTAARGRSTSSSGRSPDSGARDERPSRCNSFRWPRGGILDTGEFIVDGFRVRHRCTESFAFSFASQVRRHRLPDRLLALGVPDGPVRKDLAKGRPVVLADERTIDSEEVLGPPEGRKKLVVVGDTETTDGPAEDVREAEDLMVIEATNAMPLRSSTAAIRPSSLRPPA